MKKRIVAAALLIVMLLSMAACGAKTEAANTTVGNFTVPEGGYDGSAVTITFYNTMGTNLTPVLEAHIAEFNKLYPNITVESVNVGGYDDVRDQISTEITVGNQPNIAYCYPDHVALYNLAQAVTTLDSLIDHPELGLTAEQKADFIEGYYNEGKEFGDGLMYTLPLSKSTEVLYYNKTFFEANNLTVPTTWDELEAVCAKIKEIDPSSIPLGYDSEANWFITMCEQYGSPYTSATGDHFLFDNEQNRAFIKKFNEWFQKGYLTTQTLYGGYTSGLFT
ncbi:MAG: extracellular solute-binding protein, partial [Oscillospiraceae bacterium]|nr:extracellular solute-binding protein [Oscillospiraceae bacterium]